MALIVCFPSFFYFKLQFVVENHVQQFGDHLPVVVFFGYPSMFPILSTYFIAALVKIYLFSLKAISLLSGIITIRPSGS